ncbi:MAG: M48 family metalloprotease [Sphaerospermopsis sp. SIO1G2]|nr:M48 family metalloprotease [Sphaerospermopsis sp. SIO1G1]NET72275.1 M48 family metalloprotease [Sphaerospermopsis sp. SIO1G2]
MINWNGFIKNNRSWRRRLLYPFVSVCVAISLCLTTAVQTQAIELLPFLLRGVQIYQLSNLSPRQEFQLGSQINDQVRREVRISRNRQITGYIQSIGNRLIKSSGDRVNVPYTFQVVEDKSVNAFATTGGFVYIHTGLIEAADNEAELASVIGHEIGHIKGRHLIKQMRQSAITSGIATATGLDRSRAVGLGVELALRRPRSRTDEYHADQLGLELLTDAGYAQYAMVSFMRKLEGRSSIPTFLSTHPGASDRARTLEQQIKAQPSNKKYGLDNTAYKSKIRYMLY